MIFTFYSYKGGVGRSMALANIAHLMCDCGLNVLVVDWDLEAPGLERFLFDEPSDIKNALQQKGLLDLLLDYKNALLNFRPEAKKPFFPPYSISEYIVPIIDSSGSQGSLSLIPAGQRGNEQFTEYSNKVKSFNWQDFYQKWKGEKYFEWLRKELEKLSDVVLIDSRTGVTEMGGVCTYQMADTIIMFSSTNDQSIDGTLRMLQSFSDPDLPDLRNGRKLTTIVIPSRVEQTSEIQILNIYREKFSQTFNKHLPDELKSKFDFFLKGKNEIPYLPRYSFGELVAVKQTNTDLQAPQLEEAYKKLLITLSKVTPQDSILRRKIHEEDKTTKLEDQITKLIDAEPKVVRSRDRKKILILGDNLWNTSPLEIDEQVREITNGLERVKHRDQFELVSKWAVRPRDIQRAMLDINPQIVHFSGHGVGEEGLLFEDKTGQAKLVTGEALAELFKLFSDHLECVVLNGCYSKEQAEEIAKYIPYVIGMKNAIGDRSGIEFAVGFYDALVTGRSVEFAYKLGCSAIQMAGISENLTPVLHKKKYSSLPMSSKPNQSEMLEDHYPNLIRAITRGRIVPFLGSDINLCDRQKDIKPNDWNPNGLYPPSASELALYLEKEILGSSLTSVQCPLCDPARECLPQGCPIKDEILFTRLSIPHVSQRIGLRMGKGDLNDAMDKICSQHYTPNSLHKFLAKLPRTLRQKGYQTPILIVTANYDRTLELAFKEEKQPFDLVSYLDSEKCFLHQKFRRDDQDREKIVSKDEKLITEPNEYMDFDFDAYPVILKLYGLVDGADYQEENFVITEDHFIDYLAQRPIGRMLPVMILAKLQQEHIWFLGYGLSNWDERVPLRRIWDKKGHSSKWWAVQSNPKAMDESLWHKNGVKLIDMSLDDYVTKLEQLLEKLQPK